MLRGKIEPKQIHHRTSHEQPESILNGTVTSQISLPKHSSKVCQHWPIVILLVFILKRNIIILVMIHHLITHHMGHVTSKTNKPFFFQVAVQLFTNATIYSIHG